MIKTHTPPVRSGRRPRQFSAAAIAGALVLALAGPASLGQAQEITPEQAKNYLGQEKTVCGKVANTFYYEQGKGKPTFINLDKPYPNHIFTIIIIDEARPKFPSPPEIYYKDKTICVSGNIVLMGREDVPHIFVSDPAQIRER